MHLIILDNQSKSQYLYKETAKMEDLFRQMFERNRAVKLVIDPLTAQIIEANPAACDYYGYTVEHIKSLRLTDLSAVSEPELFSEIQQAVTNSPLLKTRHRLSSGEVRYVELFTGMLEVSDKHYLYAIVQDITEQEKADKALRESQELYRLSMQHMPNSAIIMFDTEMRYTLGDGPFLKRFGVMYDNIVGKRPDEILPKDALEVLLPIYARALQGETFSYERVTDVLAYRSYVTPVRNNAGEIIGGMILSHDITETKRAEKALRDSEERLRLILDNIEDLVTYDDVRGNFLYVSPSCKKMLGYSSESLQNANSLEFFHPDDREPMIQTLTRAIQTNSSDFTVEGRMLHAKGYYINIETVGKLVSDGGSNFTGGVFISRDITHRKLLQSLQLENERLEVALVKEKEFSAYRTRMMQYVNHEFRTPLAIIQSSSETISHYWDRLQPEQRTAKVVEIRNQINHITQMLEEIALVVNNSITADLLHRVPTDIIELCQIVCAQLEHELGLTDKFRIEASNVVIVSIDAQLIKKALFNILRNSAQYSDRFDPVIISIVTVNKWLEARIMDQGEGISEHELRRIFEPFFKGSATNYGSGLGIGLTIAKAIVEAHGGHISFTTALNKGTTVTLHLPE